MKCQELIQGLSTLQQYKWLKSVVVKAITLIDNILILIFLNSNSLLNYPGRIAPNLGHFL